MFSAARLPFVASPAQAAATCAPVWRTHRSHDVDEHVDRIGSWDLRYDQLGAGRFRAQFFDLHLSGVQIFSESTGQAVRQRGGLGEGRLGMAFMRRGRNEGACNGQPFTRGALLAWHDAELDLRTPDACELAGVVLTPHAWSEDTAATLPALSHPLSPDAPATRRLHRLVLDSLTVARRLTRHAASSSPAAAALPDPVALQQWRADVVDACLAAVQQVPGVGDPQRAQRRSQLVERACARMLTQVERQESVSQTALCQALGTSQRALAYAFQEVLGLSPLAWLRVIRLNAVRRDLRRLARQTVPTDSIYDVATRHGFWHFGRFSVEYRQHFGERPTDTLRSLAKSG